jgi:hypothetical protein
MAAPRWVVSGAALLAALPFGWCLGVLAAYVVSGSDFGQLPALTVPLGIVAAVIFARASVLTAPARLAIMVAGTALFILVGMAYGAAPWP